MPGDVTRMPGHWPYFTGSLASGLTGPGQDLPARLDRWDFEAWASSPEPHLRAAAWIAHRIEPGAIAVGEPLYAGRLAVACRVPEQVIGAADERCPWRDVRMQIPQSGALSGQSAWRECCLCTSRRYRWARSLLRDPGAEFASSGWHGW